MPIPRTSALTVLAGAALASVLLTPVDSEARDRSVGGVLPLPVPATFGCGDVEPPLPSRGRVVPPPEGPVPALTGEDVRVEVRAGTVLRWESDRPVRAAIVVGPDRAHLYWYEPAAERDAGLRPPPGPDGEVAAIHAVEVCPDGGAPPDLEGVCLRAGHVPLAGPLSYRAGAFTGPSGALPGLVLAIDEDDGTLSWRSPARPVTAVVTSAGARGRPVLVEYDPPAAAGDAVPFLGDGDPDADAPVTGRVLLCGIGVVRTVPTAPVPGSA